MNIVTKLSRNIENIRRFVQKYFLPVCHNHSFKKTKPKGKYDEWEIMPSVLKDIL